MRGSKIPAGQVSHPAREPTQEGDTVFKGDENTLRHAKEVEVIITLI